MIIKNKYRTIHFNFSLPFDRRLEGLLIGSEFLLKGIDVVPKVLCSRFEIAREFHEGGVVSRDKEIADSLAFLCFLFVQAAFHVGKHVEFDLFVERSIDRKDVVQIFLKDSGCVLIIACVKIPMLGKEWGKDSHDGISSFLELNA